MTTLSPEPHVAVLSFPFASHPSLLFAFVKRLAKAAPRVKFTVFSSAKYNNSLFSNSSGTPSNIIPHDIHDGIAENYVFVGKPMEDVNLFLAVAADEFRRGVEKVTMTSDRKITCILCDAFLWFSCDLAQEIGVPWVPYWTAGACSLTAHIYTDLIRQTLGVEGIGGRMNEKLNFIPGFSDLTLGDLPAGVIFGMLEWPFFVMLYKMAQTLPRADALVLCSFEELDPDLINNLKSKFKKIFSICPISLPSPPQSSVSDEYGCLPWLENHHPDSVAYIAFGTAAMLPPNEINALAEALEASATPFLWSMKDDLKKHLPSGFLDRTSELGKIVAWAPQVQILSHAATGVFITHSGWGSVMESIAAGVPLICRPFMGDQTINTWMIENVYKIGVRVDGGVLTKNGAIDAIAQVLFQEKGKMFRKQSTAYKELAIKAVGADGSSTENLKGLIEMLTTQLPNQECI
ncbi:Flavonoid 3-O-glucosyltransferase [Heracleum sosnowskyi]|uniref:Glycosyltransferase n=1 Tax=Heracleum sosnowskyi TaxID=360622 RepID=A0AAD8HGL6_9APIA|nr:Flavonoid 3-O-glucosyltransferase [Heracleum sosnowskyi]